MSRIRVLPEAIASRIAAGEVVERPSSVVKELVENALDAGARRVDIQLEDGGKRLVLVRDDGSGMDRDDALLAFEQHATSKVEGDGDLLGVSTFGFRGEALPAIAACSRLTLVTATADGEGTRVRIENGRILDVATVGAPRGSSVEVRGLFSALPARRKFLRSAATELSHVLRFLEQQALSLPGDHFTLNKERALVELPAVASRAERVRQLAGDELVGAALHVEGESGDIRVEAWLVRAGTGLGRFGSATTLVNGRVVSDRALSHALREAGQALFGVGLVPAGILFVDLPPEDVDVNVHPAKREVRFARSWQVHDAVRDVIRGSAQQAGAFAPAVDLGAGVARIASVPGSLFPDDAASDPTAAAVVAPSPAVEGRWSGEPRQQVAPRSPAPALPTGRRVLGQHRNTYILTEDEDGLVLIDQHCAHERILYERIMAAMERGAPSQALLVPVVVELPRSAAAALAERLEDLARLGLDVEPFGEAAFSVRAVPVAAGTADPAELLRELAAQSVPASEPLERVSRFAATVACKAAVKAGFPLGHEQMRHLADELWKTDVPTTCPHGRVAVLRLSRSDLDQRFGRP